MIKITNENYSELINSGKPVVIDFFAEWCGPCKIVGETLNEISSEYSEDDICIGKCNIDEESELAVEYNIRNIPTLILFNKDGELFTRLVGAKSKSEIKECIDQLLSE